MPDPEFRLVDAASFHAIPDPALPGARCQTCDYWERLDGSRVASAPGTPDEAARASLKRGRLLSSRVSGGPLAMLAHHGEASGAVIGYAQFGPLSAYPRAQAIRDRYPQLPESPPPWVVTCVQVGTAMRDETGVDRAVRLLDAVCAELDRRGIVAVEAYPEGIADGWLASPGPTSIYERAGFERAAGDDRFPVYRRELAGETDADAWSDLLQASALPDETEDWPLPLPPTRDPDDLFRLPPEKPRRPNPFGDD